MPLISKIYVWSLVFESLLFFQIGNQATTGVAVNLGRMLQIVVLLSVSSRVVEPFLTKKIRVPNSTGRNYILFLAVAVIGGIYGIISGAYQVPDQLQGPDVSIFSGVLNSAYVRPVFEYFIYLYYFIYFVVMPRYFLKNKQGIKYFFWAFSAVFVVSFVAGWGDIVLRVAGTGLYLPRELFSDYDIGMRFHGFAGEPRDAVVYLFFGLAMLHLREMVTGQRLTKLWIGGIIAAVLMTQSASGTVGILFFMSLYGARTLCSSFTLGRFILAVFAALAIFFILYIAISMSPRIMLYIDMLASTYEVLKTGATIPPLLSVQVNNIFPIYQFVNNVLEFNWLPVLVGSGFGSSSSANLAIAEAFDLDIWGGVLTNPNSQLVRLLFETGLIGTLFFYRTFVKTVERLAGPLGKRKLNEFVLIMLLVLGCFFAHRSSTVFIYLGIFIAVMNLSAARCPAVTYWVREPYSPQIPFAERA